MVDWWQIVLIVLGSIIVGLLVGGLLSYLVVQLVRKRSVEKRETTAIVEEQLTSIAPNLVAEVEGNRIVRLLKKPFVKERETIEQQAREQAKREAEEARKAKKAEERERKEAEAVEEQLTPTAPNLVAEVEDNHRIATEPWTGKLLPFQTGVWDTSGDDVHRLPANLREDLTQAYVDMHLANSIVWLSTELGRRSRNLDENYIKLCTSIAVRLDRATPLLKRSGN